MPRAPHANLMHLTVCTAATVLTSRANATRGRAVDRIERIRTRHYASCISVVTGEGTSRVKEVVVSAVDTGVAVTFEDYLASLTPTRITIDEIPRMVSTTLRISLGENISMSIAASFGWRNQLVTPYIGARLKSNLALSPCGTEVEPAANQVVSGGRAIAEGGGPHRPKSNPKAPR